MSAIACPHCDHQSEDPNAWRLADSHPVDCQACGKTFSLGAGQRHAGEIAKVIAAAAAEDRKKSLLAEIDQPTAMRQAVRSAIAESTQMCPFCRSEIDAEARKCPQCQEWVDDSHRKPAGPRVVSFHPGVAAALSFFIPGMGQIYKTQIALGIIVFILVSFFYLAFILCAINFRVFPGLILFLLPGAMIHITYIVDAGSSEPVLAK
jgi:TM2 domain-containing membrane protein YozV